MHVKQKPVLRRIVATLLVACLGATARGVAAAQPQKIAWQNEGANPSEWLSNTTDPGVNARVDMPEPSVLKITQDGSGTWGKAAIKVEGINLDETPIVEVKVNKVDLDSAFQVCVAPPDWSEMPVVIKRSSADGIHQGDIRKAIRSSNNRTAWTQSSHFWVVVVIEGKGKAAWLDYVRIQSER